MAFLNLIKKVSGSIATAFTKKPKTTSYAGGTTMAKRQIIAPGQTGGIGLPRGAGGKLQLPWSDPAIPAAMKAYALDDSFLKIVYRAPPGYVVAIDPQGRRYCLLKSYARALGLWKPAKKPPISVRDWTAFKRSERVMKKLRKIARSAQPRTRTVKVTSTGKRVR